MRLLTFALRADGGNPARFALVPAATNAGLLMLVDPAASTIADTVPFVAVPLTVSTAMAGQP